MKLEIAIQNAYQILKKNDIKTALLDSEILLSLAINKSREYIILNSNLNISDKEYIYYKKIVNQRSKGKPIAYLTKKKFFWKHEFYVNEKVLIPRPDTEIIIEQILKIYKNKNDINFLDDLRQFFLSTGIKSETEKIAESFFNSARDTLIKIDSINTDELLKFVNLIENRKY